MRVKSGKEREQSGKKSACPCRLRKRKEDTHLDRDQVIARLMPDLLACLQTELATIPAEHTWYTLEDCTHRIMRQVGQQGLGEAEGSGMEGPSRPCPTCAGEQAYHDQHHPLTLLTSVGAITLPQRASYRCAQCHTSTYPLDERLGVRHAGRVFARSAGMGACRGTHRDRDRNNGEVLGHPDQMRRVGEALGAELDAVQAQRVEQIVQETQGVSPPTPVRQPPTNARL